MTRPPTNDLDPDHRSEVRDALRLAARRAHATVAHADGVGVTLLLAGRPVFAGSNVFADRIDELQYRVDEGPCVSAVATARVVHTSSVGTGERRWPTFTPSARALELRSAVSTPVLVADEVVGSLNLYGRSPDSFAAALPGIVRGAEEAGRSVAELHLRAMAEATARTLVEAVAYRGDVDLAIGILMDRYAMSAGAARVLLSQLARLDDVSTPAAARGLIEPGGAP